MVGEKLKIEIRPFNKTLNNLFLAEDFKGLHNSRQYYIIFNQYITTYNSNHKNIYLGFQNSVTDLIHCFFPISSVRDVRDPSQH